jgi:serine/threonine-protein kinase
MHVVITELLEPSTAPIVYTIGINHLTLDHRSDFRSVFALSLRQSWETIMAKNKSDGMDNDPETPPNELEATQIGATDGSDPVEVIDAKRSVLNSLGRSLGHVPRVMLRDGGQEGDDPIVRPYSPVIPLRNTDDRYQLQGEIARGGMGAILKGRDNDLGRDLAVKVLLESHKDKPEVIQRFVEEAQIGGQLQHPGIAPVYELGQFPDRRPFFTMKLIKGQTLSALLAEQNGPADNRAKFLGIFEQVCQTMAYAHSRGVIHRDLKPSNIMVGAFGEVQVMDWGLAKVMPEGGVADKKKAQTWQQDVSVIETLRSPDSDLPGSFGSQTQMGSILGTPAYMAPEQALGEVDQLDQRTDVFGLGAILCEILTGQPPYIGEDGQAVFRLAARAKLDDCFARLESCGADSNLIELVRNCLESEPDVRPRDAGVLAEQVTEYLESVETRLHEAEVARAAESARAEEERKRRRVTLALAASVLFTICVGGGSWVWWEQQRAERRSVAAARVNDAVHEARLHRDLADQEDLTSRLNELEIALRGAEQAVKLADDEVVADSTRRNANTLLEQLEKETAIVRLQTKQAAADRALQERLDHIRLSQAGGAGQQPTVTSSGDWSNLANVQVFDLFPAAEQYQEVFRESGLDVLTLDVAQIAARIDNSAIRESLIGALDNWARALNSGKEDQQNLRTKLLAAADAADPSEWRKQLRAALSARDADMLQQLATDEQVDRQTPELISWLGAALRETERFDASIAMLRKAQEEYPSDFWLNYELGRNLELQGQLLEGLGYIRAARSIRPESSSVQLAIAHILFKLERYQDAGRIMSELLQRYPQDDYLLFRHAHFLKSQGKVNEAVSEYRKLIERSPRLTGVYNSLGFALHQQGKLNEALTTFQKASKLNPNLPKVQFNLGIVLNGQGKRNEALAHFQKAIELDPKFARSYFNCGNILFDQGRLDEAESAFQNVIELDPNYAPVYVNLGNVWYQRRNLNKAMTLYEKALELDPDSAPIYVNLGNVWYQRRNVDKAMPRFQKALELDPELVDAHLGLANVLVVEGKVDEAIMHCSKAIELNPDFSPAYRTRGYALQQQGKLEEAIAQYEKVAELDPRDESYYPYLAQCRNGLAWSLVRLPDSSAEDAGRGLKLAQEACEQEPKNNQYLTTLGVAYYRNKGWKSAREAFEKSIKLGRDRPINWVPLAMTHRKLGNQDEAQMWYNKALSWRENKEPNEDLQGFYEEAKQLWDLETDNHASQEQTSTRPEQDKDFSAEDD